MQNIINRGRAPKGFTLIELLVVIAIIGILASIVLVSLGSTRGSANDVKVKGQLSNIQTSMEAYYAASGNYGAAASSADGCQQAPTAPWNDTTTGLINLADEDNYPGGSTLVCTNNSAVGVVATAWAAQIQLDSGTGDFYCVDSTGLKRQNAASMITVQSDVSCL